jgi:hypothetical protein
LNNDRVVVSAQAHFGSKQSIDGVSFARDRILSITNIWAPDHKDQCEHLREALCAHFKDCARLEVCVCGISLLRQRLRFLQLKAEVQKRLGELTRPDGSVQFIARLGLPTQADASLVASLIKDVFILIIGLFVKP